MPEKRVYLGYVNQPVAHIWGMTFTQFGKIVPGIAGAVLSLMLFVLVPDAILNAVLILSASIFWALFRWNNRTLEQLMSDIWRFLRIAKRYVWSTGVLPKGLSQLQRLLHFEEVYKDSFRRDLVYWDRIIVLTSMPNFTQALEELQVQWTSGYEELLNGMHGLGFGARFVNRTRDVTLVPYRKRVAATLRRETGQLRSFYAKSLLKWLDDETANQTMTDTDAFIVLSAWEPKAPGRLIRWFAKRLAHYEFQVQDPRESAIAELIRQTDYMLQAIKKAGWQGRLLTGAELPATHGALMSTRTDSPVNPWAFMPQPVAIAEKRNGQRPALPAGNNGSLVKAV